MTINTQILKQSKTTEFIEAVKTAGFEPQTYSGRGMYGKYCVSIHNVTSWEVARALPADMDIPEPREDSLGRGNVLYWPQFAWPDGE